MIKCPNCGSTAQVRERSVVDIYNNNEHVKEGHYDCGCGHHFFITLIQEVISNE